MIMAAFISISIFSIVVAVSFWVTFLFCSCAAAELPKREAKALLQSGWWRHEYLNFTTTTPCNLSGITCNLAGSITHISLHNNLENKKLGRFLNHSSFPNLVGLDLAGAGLVGTIPPEIGSLSNLIHLDLSDNQLTAPGAVIDPSPKFPLGRTPAHLAFVNGQQGIFGFLAESSLTGYLLSLTVNELKKDGAAENFGTTRFPIATQATDRIFLMFRMQPFEKRQLSDLGIDEFGLSDEHALSLPAAKTSKAGPSYGQVHAAAVHIQKKYRGWKKRKEFLIIRQRIFKIEVVESKFFLFFKILQRSYFNIKDKWRHEYLNSTTTTACNLPGITCNLAGSIIHTSLHNYSLENKKLGRFLNRSSFQNLVSLDLSEAGLVGTIPPKIGSLSNLIHLDLSENQLTGQLPLSLLNLSQLELLDISYNGIHGSIPSDLGNLNNLVSLNLNSNSFYGPIPSSIGHLINLTDFQIHRNQINGQLPSSIGHLINLTHFDIHSNQINDQLPSSLTNLTHLAEFDASDNEIFSNHISGSIPSQIWNLTNLTHLDLGNNELIGQLPPLLGQLTDLLRLYLDFNLINGSIPVSIGQLVNLTLLRLNGNMLNGPLPKTLVHLSNLTELNFGTNNINGSIPLEIENLKNLEKLVLEDNKLTGPLPFSLCNLTNLQSLSLSFNKLSGFLPSRIGNLKNLTSLQLRSNNLVGPIALTLGSLKSIGDIDLSSNHFNGSIPMEICNLSRLRLLDLNHNSIVGEIPSRLSNLKNLTTLNLAYNNINGSIPTSILRRFKNNSLNLDGNKELYGNFVGLSSCVRQLMNPTSPSRLDHEQN
ncbi:hypothetical protein FEM48_Zijuj10G0112700 [Ziziphus jujuba var. spinosa]|uniref:Leucine-rich repeat-containing N-terminal plant-type domain-containing protein n=1 Tax=Ziziphus jujuba var. spinosa TaxID=714518 RepID=A0A978UN23_ZIZJJ|nr:hypothetical protein FEM48_Zijuj10G0112700 [Ziziphus jujuba var. spinosa]